VAVASSSVDNVSVETAWQQLAADSASVLIDVRTRAEWSFVGVPDLSSLGKELLLVEWFSFPGNQPNAAFVAELQARLAATGASKEAPLYFICRSGARSQSAAEAMLKAGYTRCCNVVEGFEGPLDDARHRGQRSGWKAQGLPWVQS